MGPYPARPCRYFFIWQWAWYSLGSEGETTNDLKPQRLGSSGCRKCRVLWHPEPLGRRLAREQVAFDRSGKDARLGSEGSLQG
jgi:hypothetical protein